MTVSDKIALSLPHMGGAEQDYIAQAFADNYIAPAGAMLDRFEHAVSDYTAIPHAVAVSSGTAALQLILHAMDIGAGDDVWVSDMTFIGGVSAIIHRGARPVFMDCDDSYTIDTALLATALDDANRNNTLPKALITTDLFGQMANLEVIAPLCRQYGVMLISDSAESLGSTQNGTHAGYHADATLLSFNGNKIITTSGGGMILSHDQKLVDRCRYLSTQARDHVLHYQHRDVGYNFRLSNICAAIGVGQMQVLDRRIQQRRAIFDTYHAAFQPHAGLTMMGAFFNCQSNRWLSVLQLDRPALPLVTHLNENGIEARPVWKPMHLQPVFQGAQTIGTGHCARLYETGLCLPSATQMSDDQQALVIQTIIEKTSAA